MRTHQGVKWDWVPEDFKVVIQRVLNLSSVEASLIPQGFLRISGTEWWLTVQVETDNTNACGTGWCSSFDIMFLPIIEKDLAFVCPTVRNPTTACSCSC